MGEKRKLKIIFELSPLLLIAFFIIINLPTRPYHPPSLPTRCKVEAWAIMNALKQYECTFGSFPDAQGKELVSILTGNNERKIKFIDPLKNCEEKYVDPWQTPYIIRMTVDSVLIRSAGPNKKFYDEDDIITGNGVE